MHRCRPRGQSAPSQLAARRGRGARLSGEIARVPPGPSSKGGSIHLVGGGAALVGAAILAHRTRLAGDGRAAGVVFCAGEASGDSGRARGGLRVGTEGLGE
eukprot:2508322-Pyramimonas_sp.AAC.1